MMYFAMTIPNAGNHKVGGMWYTIPRAVEGKDTWEIYLKVLLLHSGVFLRIYSFRSL